jgi:hypothetical protein
MFPLVLAPLLPGPFEISLVFAARRNAVCRKQPRPATIGTSNHRWGFAKALWCGFSKGCADNEKIADVARKQPSLMTVIRHHETKLFEQI